MRKLMMTAMMLSLAVPAIAAGRTQTPPKFVIVREVCWQASITNKVCAIGLYGNFASEQACIAANNGVRNVKMPMQDAREISQRCEIALQGEF